MMHPDMQLRLHRHEQKHRLHTAEQFRLAAFAQPRRPTVRIYGPVLYRIGGWMMRWGLQLQLRYGVLANGLHEMRELQKRQTSLRPQ